MKKNYISSTKSIYENLDDLTLYLEITKYEKLLKEARTQHSESNGTIQLNSEGISKINKNLQEARMATSNFGIDPTDEEQYKSWLDAHKSFIENMTYDDYKYFMNLRAHCLPLGAMMPEKQIKVLKKVENKEANRIS